MEVKERMLEFAKQTYREMVKQIDEMIPDEEQEMTPSYAIENLEKMKTKLKVKIDRFKNGGSSKTFAFHETVEEYRTVEYLIELLGRMEE